MQPFGVPAGFAGRAPQPPPGAAAPSYLPPRPLPMLAPGAAGVSSREHELLQAIEAERQARTAVERQLEQERQGFTASQEQWRKMFEAERAQFAPSSSSSSKQDLVSVLPQEVEFLKEIGRGTFGQVYRAKLRGTVVAVKKAINQSSNTQVIDQFVHEVSLMVQLHHPNLILLMGACFQPHSLFFVTELASHGSLCDVLFRDRIALSFPRKLQILKDVAQGMNWLHSLRPPLLHRDLKTSNILLDEHWRAKVSDFGLSAIRRVDASGNPLDAGENFVGSPFFMAPEALQGKALTDRADVYSFAIIIWETVTNDQVYRGLFKSFDDVVNAVTVDTYRPLLTPAVPTRIAELMKLCWESLSTRRPSFAQILSLNVFDHAALDIVFQQSGPSVDAATFWRTYFLDKQVVVWPDFAAAMSAYTQTPGAHPKYEVVKKSLMRSSDVGIEEVHVAVFAQVFQAHQLRSLFT